MTTTYTPKPIPGTVEAVPLEWILNNVTGSSDFYNTPEEDLWEVWLSRKSQDQCFEPLVSAIQEEGFRVPIILHEQGNGFYQSNGHHRVAAAILLAIDYVLVGWAIPWEKSNPDEFQHNYHANLYEGLSDMLEF